jgi:L-threonylcarbamoyladenylate synthase
MLHINAQQIEQAIDALKRGQVIVFPTETSYGLGCDATNAEAVERIFAMKGRVAGKGLPVLVPSIEAAQQEVVLSDFALDLAGRHWPGALNVIGLVAPKATISAACHEEGTQSVRMSSHPFTSTLLRRFAKPITATSANVSGQDGMYSVDHAEEVFAHQVDQPDVVIDAGSLPEVAPSTTVRVVDGEVDIIRQGSVVIS